MTKARKRKAPVTISTSSSSVRRPRLSTISKSNSSSTSQSSRTLIRRFHVLIKRRAQLQKRKECAETSAALEELDKEMETLGGLEAYQRMSHIGQGDDRGGGSEKVFIGWMNELGLQRKYAGTERKLRLLEVGALKHDNYNSCSGWVDCHPIDLRSRHPQIQEQDFLQMMGSPEGQSVHKEGWDAISLSLVVNFVPDPKDRGRMLSQAFEMLKSDGLLFVALPLPCVSNSRYMTFEHFTELMQVIGFDKLRERWKDGGKMIYWLFRKCNLPAQSRARPITGFEKKVVLREGSQRNNFSILM